MDSVVSTLSLGVTAGVYIPKARKYLGCMSIAAGAATTIGVYRGDAATAGNEIGGTNAAINGNGSDNPSFPVDVDVAPSVINPQPHPGRPAPASGIFVVTTGAGGLNLIRYST